MHLSGLFIHPVKSLRGISVTEADLDDLGLVGDRRFLVVDDQGRFLTQRTLPRMALIETALTADTLILRNPHHGSSAVPRHEPGPPVTVQVWRDTVEAEDCGVEIAVWLADFLRQPCRLVRIGRDYRRAVNPARARPGDEVSFADGYPLLAISEASVAHLNDRLQAQGEAPVPMNRFRPNLVIAGCPAHAEDTFDRFRIGEVTLRRAGPCIRCVITTTDQDTAERGPEPLRTLAMYRRDPAEPSHVNFAQNIIHETKRGTVRVGDAVTAL
ncbi:MAG: MOSC domain-containing protein [Opitutales bacterium]